jgi:hypothetical protein
MRFALDDDGAVRRRKGPDHTSWRAVKQDPAVGETR